MQIAGKQGECIRLCVCVRTRAISRGVRDGTRVLQLFGSATCLSIPSEKFAKCSQIGVSKWKTLACFRLVIN